jgi:hypothetical protein
MMLGMLDELVGRRPPCGPDGLIWVIRFVSEYTCASQ